jgi:Sulfatase
LAQFNDDPKTRVAQPSYLSHWNNFNTTDTKTMRPFVSFLLVVFELSIVVSGGQKSSTASPPNIIVFVVDDLGWNQVGYHAKPSGNDEIRTPHIDYYAIEAGIELDRGYMSPWCGPSRAAILTGRTNVYNFNVSSLISTFDDHIGYVAGLQPGTKTLATALKEYGASIGFPYKAWFNGKFGVGVCFVMEFAIDPNRYYLMLSHRFLRGPLSQIHHLD